MLVTRSFRLVRSGLLLPFYGFRIPCGFPSPAQDHLEARISLDDMMSLGAPHVYIMQVAGLSMIDAGIQDGDLIVVDRSAIAVDGDIVVAAINSEPMVKRIKLNRSGRLVALCCANPQFQDIVPAEGDSVEIWGVVTSSVRLHRK